MSGICGVFYLNTQPVNKALLAGMLDQLAHRGPDGSGLWKQDEVGFGHQLLWTTPESLHEQLPMVHPQGPWVITADARIDNRTELIQSLQLQDCTDHPITDSYLILAAYEKWGEACLDHLIGDFVFAIWDKKDKSLFLARDHLGVKPLYYYQNKNIFAFATEIKALLHLPEIPRKLNPVKVGDYLASLFDDTEITFYDGIVRLPPAHQIKVDRQGVKLARYWELDSSQELYFNSDQAYAEALKEHFETAVQCRLRSNFPIGSMLSGGMDSSSIVCMARNLLVQNNRSALKTFSAVFDQVTQCDERVFINSVVEQGNIEPHYVNADRISPLADVEKMLWHQDEAFCAPNLFMHCGLYQSAQSQNVRVVLDGFDGDTTISHGLPYITELAQQGHWIALLQEIMGFSKNFDRPIGPLLWKYLWKPGVQPRTPVPLHRLVNRLHHELFPPKPFTLSLQADFAKRIGIKERIQSMRNPISASEQTARKAHCQKLSWGAFPYALEVADKAAAAYGIEPRFPFFDKRLIEFCLAIPPSQKIHHGWTRWVMRRAMNNILPAQVQWRSGKSDLSPNFHHGLRTIGRDCLNRILRDDTDLIEPYVDVALLHQTYQRFMADKTMHDSDVLSIWKPLTLALWLRQTGLH